jgi:hypothetical protein
MPDMVKGGLIVAFAVGLFFFFRWLMKPEPALKKRAEEFNRQYEEAQGYPTDEQQQPIYDERKEKVRDPVPAFREGYPQHRTRSNPPPRPSTPPPPPGMREGSGREVPLTSSRDRARGLHHHQHSRVSHDDNMGTGVMMGMMLSSNNHSSPSQSACSPSPSYDRDSRADDNRCDDNNSSSSSNDSSD